MPWKTWSIPRAAISLPRWAVVPPSRRSRPSRSPPVPCAAPAPGPELRWCGWWPKRFAPAPTNRTSWAVRRFPAQAESRQRTRCRVRQTHRAHRADIRIGHRFRCRRHDREAAAWSGLTGQIDIERHRIDAFEPFADRHRALENIGHHCTRIGAIALVALDIELPLVTERAVEARPVHTGGGAEIIERGRSKTILSKKIERFAEGDLRLVGARATAPFRRSTRFHRRQILSFLYHFAKFLDAIYIMRDSIKINHRLAKRWAEDQGGNPWTFIFAAGLLDGDPDRTV